MKHKYAFIDLDGTLLNKRKKISQENIKVLKNFVELGGFIILITGRWPISTFFYNSEIEKFTNVKNKYLVCLNGSIVYELSNNNKIIQEKSIDKVIWKKLISFRNKFKLGIWIYFKKGIENKTILISHVPLKRIISYFNFGKVLTEKNLNSVDDVYKILFLSFSKKKIQKSFDWLKKYLGDYIEVIKTSNHNLEITAKDVNKGNSLLYILNLLKISKDEIFCLGDSGNDIPMFQESKMNIAINTKNKDVLALSNYVVHGKNGVAQAIKKYVINNPDHFYLFLDRSFNEKNLEKIYQDYLESNANNLLIGTNDCFSQDLVDYFANKINSNNLFFLFLNNTIIYHQSESMINKINFFQYNDIKKIINLNKDSTIDFFTNKKVINLNKNINANELNKLIKNNEIIQIRIHNLNQNLLNNMPKKYLIFSYEKFCDIVLKSNLISSEKILIKKFNFHINHNKIYF